MTTLSKIHLPFLKKKLVLSVICFESLDIESLFMNIPMDKTIKYAVDHDVFSNNVYQLKLSKNELSYILKIATSGSCFIFDNVYISKLMVSLGSTLLKTFLCKNFVLIIIHQNLNQLYRKHTFVLFKSKNYLLSDAKCMNTRYKNLKFKFDFEQNNSFSYLDVKIFRY